MEYRDFTHIKKLYEEAGIFDGSGIPSNYPRDGDFAGPTLYLRYPRQQIALIDYLCALPRQDDMRILVVPGSIGCEAGTLAMLAEQKELFEKHDRIEIHSLDISELFTAIAATGCYPEYALPVIEDLAVRHSISLAPYFNLFAQDEERAERRFMTVKPEIMNRIRLLPAGNVLDLEPDKPYDAVVCNWLLDHVYPHAFRYIEKLCSISRGIAHFHPFNAGSMGGEDRIADLIKQSNLRMLKYEFVQDKHWPLREVPFSRQKSTLAECTLVLSR
jgi:hypothetical protein